MRDLADYTTRAPAIKTLLAGAIDYAGLFPPAALQMDAAVRNFAEYHEGRYSWALGRFVVPAGRLGEFRDAAAPRLGRAARPWRLSVLAGDASADWTHVEGGSMPGAVADAVELRARTPDDIRESAAQLPAGIDVFFEIPIDADPAELIGTIADVRGKAKVRTGGVTADAFPSTHDLARFIVECARAGVPFKATAGLHHPLRATYRLTYEPDSPRGEMFGFLNVLVGAALARTGAGVADVAELLGDGDVRSFRVDDAGVAWRGRRIATRELADTRGTLALSFGSCSFSEPITELEGLGLL